MLNKNNNFNGKFKLEPVKTYHIDFVVKMLQKYCRHNISQKLSKQTLKSQIKSLIVIF